jgi:hypothetical protein
MFRCNRLNIHQIFCNRQILQQIEIQWIAAPTVSTSRSRESLIRFWNTLYILNNFGIIKKHGRLIKICVKCVVEFVWITTGNVQVYSQRTIIIVNGIERVNSCKTICNQFILILSPSDVFDAAFLFFNNASLWKKSYRITENTLSMSPILCSIFHYEKLFNLTKNVKPGTR